MQLKRWESPRRQGRNDKGRGGSARKRQLKKQRQMLRQQLKEGNKLNNNKNYSKGEEKNLPSFFIEFVSKIDQFLKI
ncbi:hypothetical protein [Umezakia ovalisporum]|jgi:hypothetical protein|uniref:Uncharacterized protein n=2 Tax=Umezakia ovalisporum TaxID=75695 RepID=A0AA43H2B6_9CYAN|nr:hypothetical protein [Umezakia ovalisporum]MBI1242645.1 hypothetical protein [Nostoc sp. RI_552]MDH6058454.1 hypothetical protein [Umezakia ovalisporum FSS-43]MDH6065448.1 hypothetical protein [Umezakia ovalisporum FSS-62]MDH6067051.1 hypothetical protein [Umezakia ovalisporum APH033B]MDH6071662.1 hypothetical protein [Umezakia ovalisporum CobakiLakeA]